MTTTISWLEALKQFNDERKKEGGKYIIPKKGTSEYSSIRQLMGDKSDAVELKPNQTITGQDPPKSADEPKPKKTREPSKSRTPPNKKDEVATEKPLPENPVTEKK